MKRRSAPCPDSSRGVESGASATQIVVIDSVVQRTARTAFHSAAVAHRPFWPPFTTTSGRRGAAPGPRRRRLKPTPSPPPRGVLGTQCSLACRRRTTERLRSHTVGAQDTAVVATKCSCALLTSFADTSSWQVSLRFTCRMAALRGARDLCSAGLLRVLQPRLRHPHRRHGKWKKDPCRKVARNCQKV